MCLIAMFLLMPLYTTGKAMIKYVPLMLLTACSVNLQTIEGVTTTAKTNEFLAYKQYLNQTVRLGGVVVDAGVDDSMVNGIKRSMETEVPSFYVFKDGNELYPFVVVGSTETSYDVAICFFDYDNAGGVLVLRRGSSVVIEGKVKRFITHNLRTVVVMEDCEL